MEDDSLMKCSSCGNIYPYKINGHSIELCPFCGEYAHMSQGKVIFYLDVSNTPTDEFGFSYRSRLPEMEADGEKIFRYFEVRISEEDDRYNCNRKRIVPYTQVRGTIISENKTSYLDPAYDIKFKVTSDFSQSGVYLPKLFNLTYGEEAKELFLYGITIEVNFFNKENHTPVFDNNLRVTYRIKTVNDLISLIKLIKDQGYEIVFDLKSLIDIRDSIDKVDNVLKEMFGQDYLLNYIMDGR